MTLRIILFLSTIIIAFNNYLQAQSNFLPGTITLNNGETLIGEINFQNKSSSPEQVEFRSSVTKGSRSFLPTDVTSFEVFDKKKYISKEVTVDTSPFRTNAAREIRPSSKIATIFLQVIVKGSVSLYYHYDIRPHFYVESEGEFNELISSQYVVSINGEYRLVRTNEKRYKAQLAGLGYECIQQDAEKVKFSIKSLTEYVRNCNGQNGSDYLYIPEKPSYVHSVYTGGALNSLNLRVKTTYPPFDELPKLGKFESKYELNLTFLLGYQFKIILPSGLKKKSFSFGADLSRFNSTTEGSFDTFRYNPEGISALDEVSDMELEYWFINLKAWYSYAFTASSISPYFDAGISFSRMISHNSKATISSTLFEIDSIQNDGRPVFNEVGEETTTGEFYDRDQLFKSGLGVFGGIGYQIHQFNAGLRGEIVFHNYNRGTQLNLAFVLGYQL
ncbi:MAG: hypothetical protein JJ971_03805 [Balneolaceae bacterium]|nr:hypothetical protein [Balneolaceae bacterium]MBO6545497.1 hypothetical protein [Balneolaceae bacterium]MBO6646893.1 hypothetical protein [Balneolaceae bacterium]